MGFLECRWESNRVEDAGCRLMGGPIEPHPDISPERARRAKRRNAGRGHGVASQDNGRPASLSDIVEALGSGGLSHHAAPDVLRVESLLPLHDGEGHQEQFVHAGAQRLHLRQGVRRSLDEPVVVSADERVVL